MLKTIAEVSPVLLSFIEELELPLSRPQKRHIAQVSDALITTEGSKTLSALYRSIVGDPCPKAAADTFRDQRDPPPMIPPSKGYWDFESNGTKAHAKRPELSRRTLR